MNFSYFPRLLRQFQSIDNFFNSALNAPYSRSRLKNEVYMYIWLVCYGCIINVNVFHHRLMRINAPPQKDNSNGYILLWLFNSFSCSKSTRPQAVTKLEKSPRNNYKWRAKKCQKMGCQPICEVLKSSFIFLLCYLHGFRQRETSHTNRKLKLK